MAHDELAEMAARERALGDAALFASGEYSVSGGCISATGHVVVTQSFGKC